MNGIAAAGLVALLFVSATTVCAQSSSPGEPRTDPESRVATGVHISTLGIGAEVTFAMADGLRLRAGGNWFRVTDTLNYHGISYAGPLTFASLEALVDWFPQTGKRFHISPGIVFYNADGATLTASVAPGALFTLGDAGYVSDRTNPATGSVQVDFRRTNGELLVGWGDPIRSRRRLSATFDVGVVFQGRPDVALRLSGSVCAADGSSCRSTSDPIVNADIIAEQQKISAHEATHLYLRFYPVAAAGIACRF